MRPRSESRAVSPDRLQGFGILTHVGRKSGRVYRMPVNLFQAPVCTWGAARTNSARITNVGFNDCGKFWTNWCRWPTGNV